MVHSVLLWTVSNSVVRLCDLLPYHAGQEVAAECKAAAFKARRVVASGEANGKNDLEALARACVEPEMLSL